MLLASMLPWINSGISLLTLIILTGTLWWLRRYTLAAEEQVEASQKPFLAIEFDELRGYGRRISVWQSQPGVPIILGIVPDNGLKIVNIGNGPALKVIYELRNTETGQVMPATTNHLPYLPERGFQTNLNDNSLANYAASELVIKYESLRRKPYETKISFRRSLADHPTQYFITDIQAKERA